MEENVKITINFNIEVTPDDVAVQVGKVFISEIVIDKLTLGDVQSGEVTT
jgi:hypothetical protein